MMIRHAANSPYISRPAVFLCEDPPDHPTAIKRAELGATAKAMEAFTRQTARLAFAIALGLLLFSLSTAAVIGFRTVTRSQVNYSAFNTDLQHLIGSDSSILEIRTIDTGTYSVYLDSAGWLQASTAQKAAYCESFNTAVDNLCHAYNLLGRREQAQIYYYDQDGNMLAAPGEGLQSVALQ